MIELRAASLSDVPLLRHWDGLPHVVESDPNDDWNWEHELLRSPSWREQLIAEIGGRPIGFVQIIDPAKEESRYWGEIAGGHRALDIWLGNEQDLGCGYGTSIMQQVIRRCFTTAGVHTILVDPLASNVRAHRFYQRLGFRLVERRKFGEDDCHVYCLKRRNWLAS